MQLNHKKHFPNQTSYNNKKSSNYFNSNSSPTINSNVKETIKESLDIDKDSQFMTIASENTIKFNFSLKKGFKPESDDFKKTLNSKQNSNIDFSNFQEEDNLQNKLLEFNNLELSTIYSNLKMIVECYDNIIKSFEKENLYLMNISIEEWFKLINLFYSNEFVKKFEIIFPNFSKFIFLEILLYGITFMTSYKEEILKLISNCFYYLRKNIIILIFKLKEFESEDLSKSIQSRAKINEILDQNKIWLNQRICFKQFNIHFHDINDIICDILKLIQSNILDEEPIKIFLFKIFDNGKIKYPSDYRLFLETFQNEIINDKMIEFKKLVNESIDISPKAPFLPPIEDGKKYTLVLDLDETLVHFVEEEESSYILIRPYADLFLEELSLLYEIVIFTAATQEYADFVINELDKFNFIKYRLYRQHVVIENQMNNKDLANLGRDLQKTIIIDNLKGNFERQKENGIEIREFIDDVKDSDLKFLLSELKNIVLFEEQDVRKSLVKIRENYNKFKGF